MLEDENMWLKTRIQQLETENSHLAQIMRDHCNQGGQQSENLLSPGRSKITQSLFVINLKKQVR